MHVVWKNCFHLIYIGQKSTFSHSVVKYIKNSLLLQEGTAKFAEMDGTNTISRRDRRKSAGGTASRGKFEYVSDTCTIYPEIIQTI